MSKSSFGLLILCAAPFCLQLGCQRTNPPTQPSSPSAQTQPAIQATPVETAAVAPTVTPQIQPSEPASPLASPTPLIDLPEFDVSAVIFSKNQDWKVVVDGKPSPHGIFEHPPRDGKATVSFSLEGRCKLFTAAVAINDTAKGATATPLIFIVEGDGKELWRSQPAQKCGETQPLSVDVSGVNHLTLIVDCKGPHESAHAVWVEPMLELKPGARPFHETKENHEAALAMIERLGGTFEEEGQLPGNPIFMVNLIGTKATRDDLRLLQGLMKLKHLYLGKSNILDDDALAEIAPITSLEKLHISHTPWLSDKGFRHFAGLRNLTILDLGYTGEETITGEGLVHLAGLKKLKHLYLQRLHKLEGRYLKDLAPLDNLEELYLSDCTSLGDDGLETLSQLDSLQVIDLVGSRVTDAGIKKITPTSKLKFVLLANTNTTEAGFAHLRQAGVAKYRVFGSAFLAAYDPPGSETRDVVKIRYNCRVVENRNPEAWKIVFIWAQLHKDGNPFKYNVQSQFMPSRNVYKPPLVKNMVGQVRIGEVQLSVGVPDNHRDRKVGAHTLSPEFFPSLDLEIDAIKDFWTRTHVAQADLSGKTLLMELARADVRRGLNGWCVHGELPEGDYRIWKSTTTMDGQSHSIEFALPADGAEFLQPGHMMQIATEAFVVHPGLFKVIFWNLEFQRENSSKWEPITHWRLFETDADPDENTWGMRRTTFEGRPALDVSNDGTKSYLKKGEILELK